MFILHTVNYTLYNEVFLFTNIRVQLFLFNFYLAEILQNIIYIVFQTINTMPFTVEIKYIYSGRRNYIMIIEIR